MRILFLILDIIVFFTISALVLSSRSDLSWTFFLNNCKVLIPVFILNIILLLIFSFYDLRKSYKRHKNDFVELAILFIIAFVLSSSGIYFGAYLFHIPTPKTILFLILLFFYCYVFLSRQLYNSLHLSQIKIVSIGNSRTINRLKKTLASSQEYKIVSSFNDISEISESLDIKELDFVLVSNNLLEQDKNAAPLIFNKFVSKGVTCLTDLEFFENLFLRLPKETLRNIVWLIKDISNKQENSMYTITKRLVDFFFAVCLIPIFLPLGILIYFLILFIDKQKPIFFQERVGFNGKTIQICKFRTLVDGTETPTKVGKILRKFRLDEIPQLINILDGNISIVGPRPLQKEDNDLLNKYIPAHVLRDIIKPGLTGWSQLNYKAPCNYSALKTPEFENDAQKNEYFKDAFVRLAYDVWYVKNASLLLDMEIMFKTAKRAFIKDKKLSD